MVVKIPLHLFSHNQKVAILYKKWVRHLEGLCFHREEFRYKATLARAEFDAILHQKDMRISKQMLMDKEEEFYKTFNTPQMYAPEAPDGIAYHREPLVGDWILDFWHPLEKAMYPSYFAKRELRKQQYIEMWEKQYGCPPPKDDH